MLEGPWVQTNLCKRVTQQEMGKYLCNEIIFLISTIFDKIKFVGY